MTQATDLQVQRQGKPFVKPADVVTALRIPLALAFLVAQGTGARLAIVLAAGASDLLDGMLARRFGGSSVGVVLDPVCDKLFMATAFFVVFRSGALSAIEVVGVLLRDLSAGVAFLVTLLRRRPTTIAARFGGKAVTVLQIMTLLAFATQSSMVRPLAWTTALIAIYAIVDYTRAATRS